MVRGRADGPQCYVRYYIPISVMTEHEVQSGHLGVFWPVGVTCLGMYRICSSHSHQAMTVRLGVDLKFFDVTE